MQDASGDHIKAGMLLMKDGTNWELWNEKLNQQSSSGVPEYQTLNAEDVKRLMDQEDDAHARHVLSHTRRNPKRKFPKTPRLSSKYPTDSCRIYGSLESNKVHGDFHITVCTCTNPIININAYTNSNRPVDMVITKLANI